MAIKYKIREINVWLELNTFSCSTEEEGGLLVNLTKRSPMSRDMLEGQLARKFSHTSFKRRLSCERPRWSVVMSYIEHHGLWLLYNCDIRTSVGPTV